MTYSEQGPSGEVRYNKDIILSVIKIATKEIPGVSALCENFGSLLKRMVNYRYSDGVRISFNNNLLTIHVYIVVAFGNNVTELASKVQQNIKNAVTSMLGLDIDKINVHVLGVTFKKEEPAPAV